MANIDSGLRKVQKINIYDSHNNIIASIRRENRVYDSGNTVVTICQSFAADD
jgi:hypothetical protein